ncbi:MAG: phosphoribosyltransferase [Candidatus Magasanikbacteria bacterium]|nr:phosphoribosyltransferase [Candidatus Magasanikbacteria bacterium]
MNLLTKTSRVIRGDSNPDGRLEVIEDVGISPEDQRCILDGFTVPTHIVEIGELSEELWRMIQDHASGQKVVFLCPGNGAWLVERALQQRGIYPNPVQPVDISRESTSDIQVNGKPERVIVLEDVVETGGTARKIANGLSRVGCPVTLATTLWHDREEQTKQVLDSFRDYDHVLVSLRVRSGHEQDDVRSLSTLARKATILRNQRYSMGREGRFLNAMHTVLEHHAWLHRLGVNLGYRQDAFSVAATDHQQST